MVQQCYLLRLTSNPNNVAKVEGFVEEIANRFKLTPDIYGNILISLTEAVNNAIIHGNRHDERKHVQVRLEQRHNKLAFHISDEGRGFDHKCLPDPTCPENLLRIGGRGVFLMKELSDRIDFFNNGSTIRMEFNL